MTLNRQASWLDAFSRPHVTEGELRVIPEAPARGETSEESSSPLFNLASPSYIVSPPTRDRFRGKPMADGALTPDPIQSPQHDRLLAKVGTWDVNCSYYMGPDCEALEAPGVDVVEAVGAFWTVGHFSCELPGTHIVGRATLGYDPERQKYVSTWFDSANPFLYYFEGQLSADGNKLEMTGDNIDPTTRNLVKYRSVETRIDDNTRTLQLFVEFETDHEIQILQYRYTRRG